MKIKRVENNEENYPKANEISAEEPNKKLPKKFLKLGALGVGVAALTYGVILYQASTTIDMPLSGVAPINTTKPIIDQYSGEQIGSDVKLFLKEIEKLNSQEAFPIDVTGIIETDINDKETYIVEFFDNNLDGYIDEYHIKVK